jgi:hypothetical protein
MAGEIRFRYVDTGRTNLYVIRRRATVDSCWTGTTWEAMTVSHWSTYAKPAAESPAGSYVYVVDCADFGVIDAVIEVFEQAGASPAISDLAVMCGAEATFLPAAYDPAKSAGSQTDLTAVKTQTDKLSFAGSGPYDVKATLDSEAVALASAERNAIADAVLSRDVAAVEATAGEHSLCYLVLAAGESNTVDHAGFLTVYRTDGETEFCQKALTSSLAAQAITGIG